MSGAVCSICVRPVLFCDCTPEEVQADVARSISRMESDAVPPPDAVVDDHAGGPLPDAGDD